MHHDEIAHKFLEYFKKHNHLLLESSSLIPQEADPSALFINSGMHPIKKYFLGLEVPPSQRLCSIQRCFRSVDIDNVGENKRTLTFFFMLGNWSIGEYWKEEAVKLAYDLLVNGFKIDKKKLWATVFKGNKEITRDKETAVAWEKMGLKQIAYLGEEHNFWTLGENGPCGPSTEIYYDLGENFGCGKKDCKPGCDCDRFLEIWNLVFIEYKKENGILEKLKLRSVDTGAGLERFCVVLQNKESVFETSLFSSVLENLENISKKEYRENKKPMNIILDHLRASCFLINDGLTPSKMERGYVLRRLIRRAIRYGNTLNVQREGFLLLIDNFGIMYNELDVKLIKNVFNEEYSKFIKALNRGNRIFESYVKDLEGKAVSGDMVFKLYDTYGFPVELTKEMARERGLSIDEKGYEKSFVKHKEVSRKSAEKKFKGGLADESYETTKLHTATHLLAEALRRILSKDIEQKGSNITSERARFDFNFPRKITNEKLKKIENLVNEKIREGLKVDKKEMSVKEAKKIEAHGVFEEKYGEKIFVYSIGDFSKEICGGPHAKNTKEIGKFKIVKEESVSAGVRRIKAIVK